jgi:hypothetical protein
VFLTVTVAFGITPPLGSSAVPAMLPPIPARDSVATSVRNKKAQQITPFNRLKAEDGTPLASLSEKHPVIDTHSLPVWIVHANNLHLQIYDKSGPIYTTLH